MMIKAILLATVVPFMAQHRNMTPSMEVTTNFYGSVTGVVDNAYIAAHGGGGSGGVSGQFVTNAIHNIVDKEYVDNLGKYTNATNAPASLTQDITPVYAITFRTGTLFNVPDGKSVKFNTLYVMNPYSSGAFGPAHYAGLAYCSDLPNWTTLSKWGFMRNSITQSVVRVWMGTESTLWTRYTFNDEITLQNNMVYAFRFTEQPITTIGGATLAATKRRKVPCADTADSSCQYSRAVIGVSGGVIQYSPDSTCPIILALESEFSEVDPTATAKAQAVVENSIRTNFVAASTMPPWITTSEGRSAGQVGKTIEYYENGKHYKWGVDYAAKAAYAKETDYADTAYQLKTPGGYGPYPWTLEFDGTVFQDNGGRLVAHSRDPISSVITGTKTNAWMSDVIAVDLKANNLQSQLNSMVVHKQNIIQIHSASDMEAGDRTFDDVVQYVGTGTAKYHFGYFYKMRTYSPRVWDVVTPVDLSGYVPTSRTVNGQPLTSDITIEGMTDNAVVITEGKTKTKAGAKVTGENMEVSSTDSTTVKGAIENTQAIVQTWESFLDGSNVVFSITNYTSGAYSLNTAKLKILEMRDGEYREVYNSRGEIVMHINDFNNNYVRVALADLSEDVAEQLVNKADKDWGKYTSSGGEAPSNTVYMTAPNTVFAGGMEYERVAVGLGSVCILTTKGAPTYTTGDEGTFKFQDDGGTNYFGFAKSDSYTLGCNTDGITVTAGIVTLLYDVTMSGTPCIWYKASLEDNTPWEQLNTPDGNPIPGASKVVTWDDNPDPGTKVCYLNCSEPSGFFKTTIEVAGAAKFMTNMPADLMRGIICTNTSSKVNGIIKPSYNGSQVIWTWSAQ